MSRRRRNETEEQYARRELISEFLSAANIRSMDDIQELFKEALAGFMEGSLEAELDSELGYEPYDVKNKNTENSRNGHSKKTLQTSMGKVDIDVPRDRNGENESAKFWANVLNSLRNRGVEDILIACTDNLSGFSQAIEAVFPKTDIQNCIIHQLRNSSKYVSYKDIKALMADLKKIYTAVDEEAALNALDEFAAKWDGKYLRISKSWYDNWANLSTYFKFPQELRKLIYTTNTIEVCRHQMYRCCRACILQA